MPQLRSCYFCGAVGDSLQEYEVVPERLVAPGGERSAVLCSACHEKLRRVLEPLVDAAESSSERSNHGLPDVGEVTFDAATDAQATDAQATDGREDEEPTPDVEVTKGEEGSAADGDVGDDADASVDMDTSTGADETATDEGDGETDDVPDGYYKVLRLLQNREFPMERTDLTALVTGAYDVSEPQCERILAVAIDRGVLVEDGSTLDIGRN